MLRGSGGGDGPCQSCELRCSECCLRRIGFLVCALELLEQRWFLSVEAMGRPEASFFSGREGTTLSGGLPGVRGRGSKRDVVHDALNFDLVVASDEAEVTSLPEFMEFADVVVNGPVVQSAERDVRVSPGEAVPTQVRT